MSLPDNYLLKYSTVPAYFDAILNAQAPQRFSLKFLENLDFKSPTDRLLIGVLKELKFLDADGVPTKRYYDFLDRSQAKKILATAVRETYADLFAVNTDANKLSPEDVKNKLRSLYAGKKTDVTIARIARTFTELCQYADFSSAPASLPSQSKTESPKTPVTKLPESTPTQVQRDPLSLSSLQYHINIVLPESRDQAVYDALFKSLRDHLG